MGISFRFFRFIRRHVRPIEPNKAIKWKSRLNLLYIFFAWNAVGGIVLFHSYGKGKDVVVDNSAEAWANFLKLPNTVNIVKMKGFRAMESYQYVVPTDKKEDEDEEETEKKAELTSA